jgi:hypothetical protein
MRAGPSDQEGRGLLRQLSSDVQDSMRKNVSKIQQLATGDKNTPTSQIESALPTVLTLSGSETQLPGEWLASDTIKKVKEAIEQQIGTRYLAQKLYTEGSIETDLGDDVLLASVPDWHLLLVVDEIGAEEEIARLAEERGKILAAARARREALVAAAVAPCYIILGVAVLSIILACFFGVNVASIVIAEKYKSAKCEQKLDYPLLMVGVLGIASTLFKWYLQLRLLFRGAERLQSPWPHRFAELLGLVQLYFFIQLITGAYAMFNAFGFERKYECPRTLYLFSFWICFAPLIFIFSLIFVLFPCIMLLLPVFRAIGCGRRRAAIINEDDAEEGEGMEREPLVADDDNAGYTGAERAV